MSHGRHIYANASDISKAIICSYPHPDHALPHWKCILRFFSGFPYINLPDQERNKNTKKQHPQLSFTFIASLDVILLRVKFH